MGQLAVIDRQQSPAVPSFDLSDLEKIATTIARGGMFGSSDPYAVLTLCMLAQAEGQHPAVVFRDYDIIQGKPSKKAKAMLSDFLTAGGKVVWNRLDDECAEATFSHPQGGEATINWTIARAQKAGLGGKDMWKKYPRQMLRSRVISEGVSTIFPGATSGLYVPEEVMDFDDAKPTPPVPQAQRARDLKRVEDKTEDSGHAKAEKWLAQYEADLKAATSKEELAKIHAKADNAVAKLAKNYPDLHARALVLRPAAAVGSAGEASALSEDDAADALPTRDDSQTGEIVTLAEARDQIAAQTDVPSVNRLVRALEHGFDEAEADELRVFAAERCDAILREQGGE